jgi:hypothetical protein
MNVAQYFRKIIAQRMGAPLHPAAGQNGSNFEGKTK